MQGAVRREWPKPLPRTATPQWRNWVAPVGQDDKRSAYLKERVQERGGAKDSLDDKIYRTVREQAGELGLVYESDTPDY